MVASQGGAFSVAANYLSSRVEVDDHRIRATVANTTYGSRGVGGP
jgi:hypothetical protein